MKSEIPLLQYVRVAAPCPADWNEMKEIEGDRVKFCSGCQKRVYNLSAMGQAEAEGLLRRHEGHLCVRYYRRRDGTILTTDCPVGLKAARELAFRRARVSFAACLLFYAAFASYRTSLKSREQEGARLSMPVAEQAMESIEAKPVEEDKQPEGEWIAGGMSLVEPPARRADEDEEITIRKPEARSDWRMGEVPTSKAEIEKVLFPERFQKSNQGKLAEKTARK
jgi:hypothetical protein